MRPIILREPLVRGCGVLRDVGVGNDASQHTFPGMAMAVHEARDHDGVRGIDNARRRAGGLYARRDSRDFLSLDENVTLGEIAHSRVHADDRSAFKKDGAVWIWIERGEARIN